MKARIWIGVVGLVVSGVGFGVAHWLDRSRAGTEASLAALAAHRAELAADAAHHRTAAVALEAQRVELRDTVEAFRKKSAAAGVTAQAVAVPAEQKPMVRPRTPREVIENDPQLQTLWLRSGRGNVMHEYGPFFSAAQLTPGQIERFQAALLKRQEQLMDLAAVGQAQGAESRGAVDTLRNQANAEFDREVGDALGADGYIRFKEYERVVRLRPMVERIAGAATVAGEPLTAAQADQLTALVAKANPDYIAGGRADLANVDWIAADAAAQQLLSPAQMALFKRGVRVELQLDAALARAQQQDAQKADAPRGG
jgi:hypothetical protein